MRIDRKISKTKNPKVYFDKGLALIRLKLFKEAVEAFKNLLTSIQKAHPHFQIGNAFLEMGQLPMAKKAFEKSLSINSASSIAHHKLSVVFSKMRKTWTL